jgi:hypothetical protein
MAEQFGTCPPERANQAGVLKKRRAGRSIVNLTIAAGLVVAANTVLVAPSMAAGSEKGQVRGTSGMRTVEIAINRPVEPKAKYTVIAIGNGPEVNPICNLPDVNQTRGV